MHPRVGLPLAFATGLALVACSGEPARLAPVDAGTGLDAGAAPLPGVDASIHGIPTHGGLKGVVQKGPFIQGSTVTLQELNTGLVPTGVSFTVTTTDDEGSFVVPATVTANYVEVFASGFYFDELTGRLSEAPIALGAIVDVSAGAPIDVNLMTSMAAPRLRDLVAQRVGFSDALTQSQAAVLAACGFGSSPSSPFTSVSITDATDSGAALLAASLIIESYARSQGPSEVAQLTQLLAHVGASGDDGGDDPVLRTLHAALCPTAASIDVVAVRSHLESYYASLGASITVPPFEHYVAAAAAGCADAGGDASTGEDAESGAEGSADANIDGSADDATEGEAGTTIAFASGPDWTWTPDPSGGTPLPAVDVCLAPTVPTNCPAGALVYANGGGWVTVPGAFWIWRSDATPDAPGDLQSATFAKMFVLGQNPTGTLSLAADDYAQVVVNGAVVGSIGSVSDIGAAWASHSGLTAFTLDPYLVEGTNTLAIEAQNGPPSFSQSTCAPCSYAVNAAGVVFEGSLSYR